MKSSVRILAIALALAFLLLARTAFQDTTSAKEHIDLKDGEASFADPLNGLNEAKYLGLGDGATTSVYFYIESKDLGTQVTARTTEAGTGSAGTLVVSGNPPLIHTLQGGNTTAAQVEAVGDTSTDAGVVNAATGRGGGVEYDADTGRPTSDSITNVINALDRAYCAGSNSTSTLVQYSDAVSGAGHTQLNTATTSISASDWGVSTTTVAAAPGASGLVTVDGVDAQGGAATFAACGEGDARVGSASATATTTVNVLSDKARTAMATKAIDDINKVEIAEAEERNHLVYMYKSGTEYVAATSTTPDLRYTANHNADSATDFGDVGGSLQPLSSVSYSHVDTTPGDPDLTPPRAEVTKSRVTTPNSVTGEKVFRLLFAPDPETPASVGGVTDTRERRVNLTYDIVDVYEHDESAKRASDPYAMYTSGYKRAYVSSGSDSGQWVTISEVASVSMMHNADGSPTTNLFRGSVVVTNDTSELGSDDNPIYVQDGDTLTLQVFDENDDRSSDVLASATALIDNSPPTISDLSPADESIINDDELRISFSVDDEGAGADFRNIEKVVTAVYAQERDESASTANNPHKAKGGDPEMGRCELAMGEDDIDNAGGNASRVGVLIAPSDTDFTDKCSDEVDTTSLGLNGHGKKFNLIIVAEDLAGNETTHTTQLTIDTAKPVLDGNPAVGQAWDEDKNKAKSSANSILVKFTESVDVDTVAVADFTVAGYSVDSVEVVGTNDDAEDDPDKKKRHLNEYVVLTLTEDLTNNARPSVTVTGISDVAGNAMQTATRTSDNKIKADVTVVPFAALIAEDGQQAITFTTDEALRSKSSDNSTEGSVGDDKVKITVADDTMGGNAAFKESKYGGSRAYGVLLQVVDVDSNVSKAGEVKVSDEAYELTDDVAEGAKFDVTLDNWPLADTGFDNDVKGEVKAYIGKTMVASSTGEVGWEDGAVELVANAKRSFDKGDTINLSYSYVHADQVIQVDVDEPTMESIPADNAETDYAAGAIQFEWTEEKEYAGDTYKTVTLNEASHEGPSGTSTDILSELTTHDDKTWVYRPAADLALGDHEFTLKATDAAGNSNEVSVTITVIERKPVKISLSPGWNLISFPGAPASVDVNDVFSSDTVSVVSQYDGRRVSPWTVWTRGEDGSLSSSPAGRTTVDSGLGLYVLSSDGSALEVDIPGVSKDAPAEVPPSIDLIPGWNLVAVILVSVDEVGVNEYLPEGVWTRAFRLNNTTGQFDSFTPPSQVEGEIPAGESLEAGDALWVYATKAGTIVPK